MTTRYHARAIFDDNDTLKHAEIVVVEQYWSQDDGWQEGDVVDHGEWRVSERSDDVLERMGWQRVGTKGWVYVVYGYVVGVKPLALF
jgi:hypothetical protein